MSTLTLLERWHELEWRTPLSSKASGLRLLLRALLTLDRKLFLSLLQARLHCPPLALQALPLRLLRRQPRLLGIGPSPLLRFLLLLQLALLLSKALFLLTSLLSRKKRQPLFLLAFALLLS